MTTIATADINPRRSALERTESKNPSRKNPRVNVINPTRKAIVVAAYIL